MRSVKRPPLEFFRLLPDPYGITAWALALEARLREREAVLDGMCDLLDVPAKYSGTQETLPEGCGCTQRDSGECTMQGTDKRCTCGCHP